ncbi:MAG: hypothetical protein WDN01_16340 [Rhizomicrobium sp.]
MNDGHEHYAGASEIGLADYTFQAHKATFACQHVMAGKPVLSVFHEMDGDLQFLCGTPDHDDEKPILICLHCVTERHPDLLALPTVDFGMVAWRKNADAPWTVAISEPNA